jgi:hypothetical protein
MADRRNASTVGKCPDCVAAHWRARDGLRTFTPCERKFDLSSQVGKVASINQDAQTSASVTINVRTFQKADLIHMSRLANLLGSILRNLPRTTKP